MRAYGWRRGAAEDRDRPVSGWMINLYSSTERWRENEDPRAVTSANLDLCGSGNRVPCKSSPRPLLFFLLASETGLDSVFFNTTLDLQFNIFFPFNSLNNYKVHTNILYCFWILVFCVTFSYIDIYIYI